MGSRKPRSSSRSRRSSLIASISLLVAVMGVVGTWAGVVMLRQPQPPAPLGYAGTITPDDAMRMAMEAIGHEVSPEENVLKAVEKVQAMILFLQDKAVSDPVARGAIELLEHHGKWSQAAECMLTVGFDRNDPRAVDALLGAGVIAHHERQLGTAHKLFDMAVAISEGAAEPRFFRAIAYALDEDRNAALDIEIEELQADASLDSATDLLISELKAARAHGRGDHASASAILGGVLTRLDETRGGLPITDVLRSRANQLNYELHKRPPAYDVAGEMALIIAQDLEHLVDRHQVQAYAYLTLSRLHRLDNRDLNPHFDLQRSKDLLAMAHSHAMPYDKKVVGDYYDALGQINLIEARMAVTVDAMLTEFRQAEDAFDRGKRKMQGTKYPRIALLSSVNLAGTKRRIAETLHREGSEEEASEKNAEALREINVAVAEAERISAYETPTQNMRRYIENWPPLIPGAPAGTE